MWYVIAGISGALVAAGLIYAWRKLSNQGSGFTYSSEQAEKERERITAHADSFRERIAEETKKGHDAIDDF